MSSFARKVIQDALVKTGTLHDDGWDYVTGYLDNFKVDKQHPRIEVQFIEQTPTERSGRKCQKE